MSAEADVVVVDCDLDASPDQVWRALTEPDLLSIWLAEAAEKAEVVDARPGEELKLAWRERDDAGDLIESEVRFTLTPIITGGTRLRLVHDGFVRTPIMAMARSGLASALRRSRLSSLGGLAWAA